MHAPCIAWDGNALMALKSRHWEHFLYTAHSTFPLEGGPLGQIQLLSLCARPEIMTAVKGLLDSMDLHEFVQFYRRAGATGLIGKNFKFQMLAVCAVSGPVRLAIGMDVSHTGVQVRYAPGGGVLAVGRDAYAAMLLMTFGDRTADTAVFAQAVMDDQFQREPMDAEGAYYDRLQEQFKYQSRHFQHARGALALMEACVTDMIIKDTPCAPVETSGTTTLSGPGNDSSTPT